VNIGVIHGSNLNRLGIRNPAKYGRHTLDEITQNIDDAGHKLGFRAVHVQSNHEGDLVEWVHAHVDDLEAIVVNPAGFTSAGYPLLDALKDTNLPFAVVHISQFHAIDGKERADIFAPYATAYIAGAGWQGYRLACEALVLRAQDARSA
jgi:3-dehydroquinate dehydratase-2